VNETVHAKQSQFLGNVNSIVPNNNNVKLLKQQSGCKKILQEAEDFEKTWPNHDSSDFQKAFEDKTEKWKKDIAAFNTEEEKMARQGLAASYVIQQAAESEDVRDLMIDLVQQSYDSQEGRTFILQAVALAFKLQVQVGGTAAPAPV
jgi:hypothetical protein